MLHYQKLKQLIADWCSFGIQSKVAPADRTIAEEKIKQINEAYAVLSDVNQRRQYDQTLPEEEGNESFSDAEQATLKKYQIASLEEIYNVLLPELVNHYTEILKNAEVSVILAAQKFIAAVNSIVLSRVRDLAIKDRSNFDQYFNNYDLATKGLRAKG